MNYKAKFYDGKHANSYEVNVTIKTSGISFSGESLQIQWLFNDTIIVERPEHKRPLILTHRIYLDARLVIENGTVFSLLKEKLPKKHTPKISIPVSTSVLLAWTLAALAVAIGLYTLMPGFTAYIAKNLPPSWEETIGEQAIQVLTVDKKRCVEPTGVQALNILTKRLSTSLPEGVSYTVQIIEETKPNAFAAPGGKIVVFSGLIEQAETPEELAGVIAHELGHVVERHPTQGLAHALGFGLIATFVFGDGSGATAVTIANALLQLKYSRKLEEQADQRAIEYLQKANIKPEGLAVFFERIEDKKPDSNSKIFDYFSTHPATKMRIEKIKQSSNYRIVSKELLSKSQWQALKNICK